jgi:gamma-glutamylcysteine synthetase
MPPEDDCAALIQNLAKSLGLEVIATDDQGRAIKACWPSGDLLSFEFSYGALEISMAPSTNLLTLSRRLDSHLSLIRGLLAERGYVLGFCGSHPFSWAFDLPTVRTPYYALIANFLRMFASERAAEYSRFNSYVYACQTHVDARSDTVIDLINVLNSLGWARALLLANSPFLPGASRDSGTLCLRDCLWDMSAFAADGRNVGPYRRWFTSIEDFLAHEAGKSMFRVQRGQDHLFFPPLPMSRLLSGEQVSGWLVRPNGALKPCQITGHPGDLASYRNYNDIALTPMGTLEIRGDCQQPADSLTAPAALYLGLSANLQQAHEFVHMLHGDEDCPHLLRRDVVDSSRSPFLNSGKRRLLESILSLAKTGLCNRGQGEEALLAPLYQRLEARKNPAMQWIEHVQKGLSPSAVAIQAALPWENEAIEQDSRAHSAGFLLAK